MTRTELHAALNRNHSSARIQIALELLMKQGRARCVKGGRAGRTGPFAETWFYVRRRPS
jgi:hypothetical protein